ncbi:MAG: DUF4397 domain-containing protein [Pseudomonadota bacterium]
MHTLHGALNGRHGLSTLIFCFFMALFLSACDSGDDSSDEDSEANPSRSLRLVNAVTGTVAIGWEISESDQGTVDYGRASAAQALIDGEKPLTFYQVQADGDREYFDLTFDYDLDGDFDVLLVLVGSVEDLQLEVVEVPGFDLDEDFGRVGMINLTSAIPSLDLYLLDGDDSVFSEPPILSSDTRFFSGVVDVDEGEYELRFTRSGEQDVLFDGGTVDIDEDVNHFYLVMDFAVGSDSLLLLEVQGDGLTRQLIDEDTPARLRLFNGIPDYPAVDLYLGDTAGEPIFANVGFQSMTDYLEIDPDAYSINVTPAGVVDTFFYEAQISLTSGNYLSLVIAGLSQDDDGSRTISGNVIADEVQPLNEGAKVSFVHASTGNEAIDVYLLLPGQPVDDSNAVVTGLSPFLTFDFEEEAGDYQITLIQSSNDAVILAPVPITLADGDIVELLFTDSPGGGTPGELVLIRTDIE